MLTVIGSYLRNNTNQWYEENSSEEEISLDETTTYDHNRLPSLKEMRRVQKEMSNRTHNSNRHTRRNVLDIDKQEESVKLLKHHVKNFNLISFAKEGYEAYKNSKPFITISDEHMLAKECPGIDINHIPFFIKKMDQEEEAIDLFKEKSYRESFVFTDSREKKTSHGKEIAKFSLATGLSGIGTYFFAKATHIARKKRGMGFFKKSVGCLGLGTLTSVAALYTTVCLDKTRQQIRNKWFEAEYPHLEFHNRSVRLQQKIEEINEVLEGNFLDSSELIETAQRIRDYFEVNLLAIRHLKEELDHDLVKQSNAFEKVSIPTLHKC